MVAEIIDPEDHVLGSVERTADIGTGDSTWQQVIKQEKPLRFESKLYPCGSGSATASSMPTTRTPAIEGVESISQILRRPVGISSGN